MYDLPDFIVGVILTAAVYCVFPLIYAQLRCKRVTAKSYRTICYCVNFAVTVLIAMFSFTPDPGNNSSAGVLWSYIFWTGILTRPGVKILRSRGVLEDSIAEPQGDEAIAEPQWDEAIAEPQEGEASAENDTKRAEAAESTRRTLRFCTRCGFELAENSRFCSRCGTSVDDM